MIANSFVENGYNVWDRHRLKWSVISQSAYSISQYSAHFLNSFEYNQNESKFTVSDHWLNHSSHTKGTNENATWMYKVQHMCQWFKILNNRASINSSTQNTCTKSSCTWHLKDKFNRIQNAIRRYEVNTCVSVIQTIRRNKVNTCVSVIQPI